MVFELSKNEISIKRSLAHRIAATPLLSRSAVVLWLNPIQESKEQW
jgi:hypothetical protein